MTRVSIKAAAVPLLCRAGGSAASPGGSAGVDVVAGGYQRPRHPWSAFLRAVAPSHKAPQAASAQADVKRGRPNKK